MANKVFVVKFPRSFPRSSRGMAVLFAQVNRPVVPGPNVFETSRDGETFRVRRQQGMSGILSVLTSGGSVFEAPTGATSQPWWIPDAFYDWQNQASPDQVYAANQAANAGIVQAETNPITGQIVPAAQAYANKTAGAAGAAEAQGMTQSTGSPIADAFNALLANLVGTGSPTPTQTPFPWGTVLIVAAVAVGGYFVVTRVL